MNNIFYIPPDDTTIKTKIDILVNDTNILPIKYFKSYDNISNLDIETLLNMYFITILDGCWNNINFNNQITKKILYTYHVPYINKHVSHSSTNSYIRIETPFNKIICDLYFDTYNYNNNEDFKYAIDDLVMKFNIIGFDEFIILNSEKRYIISKNSVRGSMKATINL